MIYVGDIGIEIIYNCGEDISTATVLKFKYRKPGNSIGSWIATLEGTQSLKYITTAATCLDRAGLWYIQPYLEFSNFKGHGQSNQFEVNPTVI